LLTIDIQGIDRFEFNNIEIEEDGLKQAHINLLVDWKDIKIAKEYEFLAQSLEQILALHPIYQKQLINMQLDSLTWVCQRWLEILPISIDKKYSITQQQDMQTVINFVKEIVNK
ncbi:MAG: hypothetical protein V7782_03150, partial [Psychromonas sp.]